MTPPGSVRAIRHRAQQHGRALRDALLAQFADEYGLQSTPPPALIVDELITDLLGAELRRLPLPDDRFAQTQVIGGRVVVTVNSLAGAFEGVKYPDLVENVAKWHEVVHIDRDLQALDRGPQLALEGLGPPPLVACYRRVAGDRADSRESFAEDAGRAGAVSYRHLFDTQPFRELVRLGSRRTDRPLRGEGWRLLYGAAEAIYVNPSALVTQLRFDGWITVERHGDAAGLLLQPALLASVGAA